MSIIHHGIGVLVDLAMRYLAALGPAMSLAILSLVVGVALALLYGKVSFQTKLREVKRRIHAGMLEAVLFRHDTKLALKAQGRMLAGGVHYFLLAIPPLLILALPCIFILGQFNSWFGYEAPVPGQSIVVRAKLADSAVTPKLHSRSEDFQVLGPLRAARDKEVLWRLSPLTSGNHEITLDAAPGSALVVEIPSGTGLSKIEPIRSEALGDRLLYPSSQSGRLPPGISALEILYPERSILFFGYHTHWIVPFLLVSLLGGFVAARAVGVEL